MLKKLLPALVMMALLFPGEQLVADDEPELRVRGYGFWGNREMRSMLRLLEGTEVGETYSANFVEDAALILLAHLHQDGYLRPEVEATVVLPDETEEVFVWDHTLRTVVPRELRAKELRFRVYPGVLFHFGDLEIEGLETIPLDEAKGYFVTTGFLLPQRRARVYTEQKLERGIGSLREVLNRQGYEQPSIDVALKDKDEETGRVDVVIRVEQGRRSIVRQVRQEVYFSGAEEPSETDRIYPDVPYSRIWQQDYAQEVRSRFDRQGYPDLTVQVRVERREVEGDVNMLDLASQVRTGPRRYFGEVHFQGDDRTQVSVMNRRMQLEHGEPFSRMKVEEARHRLSRLGVFDSIEVETVDDGNMRDVIVTVDEGRRLNASLLAGYGSFEQLRGGVELEQFNLFGRAHRSRLFLVQSMRSTRGQYLYTVPELFGEEIDGFIRGSGIRRREVTFLREEYGGSVGLQSYLHFLRSDGRVRYNYELLQTKRLDDEEIGAPTRTDVASLEMNLRRDRRDNPINPRRSYNAFINFELASQVLGGDVDFQRIELGGSYHKGIGGGLWIHTGIRQAVILSAGRSGEFIPFNKRFFPGGENSVRGYRSGEAAPRNAVGDVVGAEVFTLVNLEFEQRLTPNWAVVLFSDTVGLGRRLEDSPLDEILYSVGVGVRYDTIIGPIRMEYGYNLNRRDFDPRGTLHLSIGFPF